MKAFVFSMSTRAIVLTLALLPFSSQLWAFGKHVNPDFSWHGFISQGYAYTSRNSFLGTDDGGSPDFTEAGINAAWEPHQRVLLSGQLLYRRAGEAQPMGTRIDYAIVDWRVHDALDSAFGLRLGRLKNPYGFFSETRDVAATRPGVILPEGTYSDYQREVSHSMDAIGLYTHRSIDSGTWILEANVGRPILDDDTETAILNAINPAGELENERAMLSRISYEENSGSWRAAISFSQFQTDFDAAPGDPIADGEIEVDQLLLSFEYNWERWQFVSEAMWRDITYDRIFGSHIEYDGLVYYGQVTYRVNTQWSIYGRQEDTFLDKNDKDGKDFARDSGFTRPAHDAFAKDSVLGLRFQPNLNWTFGLEYHRVDGTAWLPQIENPDPDARKRHWEMYLFQAAYRF